MKTLSKILGLTVTAVALAIQQTAAIAQQAREIDVDYSPIATPIPTLSQWALMGLSLLLAAVAIYALRNRAGGKPLASVILVFAVTLGGLSGRNLIERGERHWVVPRVLVEYNMHDVQRWGWSCARLYIGLLYDRHHHQRERGASKGDGCFLPGWGHPRGSEYRNTVHGKPDPDARGSVQRGR